MRSFVLATTILATGCFRYAPVSSLSSVEDDRVRVYDDEQRIAMEHATAHGRVIQGEPIAIIAGSAIAVAGAVIFGVIVAIASASRPVPFQ